MMYVNARAPIERETDHGTELLLQYRERAGEPRTLECPGGQLEEFEPILGALEREIREETGLQLTAILNETNRFQWDGSIASVECLTPFFAYQTVAGPVDSIGFYFRCRAEGTLTTTGDGASGHTWVPITELERRHKARPDDFGFLDQAALHYYFTWRRSRS